ncbi:MAG: HAD hydrolase-like protein [Actinobacteria bacterium]|nr:HAD hydrolase-like protein [Actinomycetota bacterium]
MHKMPSTPGHSIYDQVIFDFDGVLCDNSAIAMEIYNSLCEKSYLQLRRLSERAELGEICSGPSAAWLHDQLTPAQAAHFWTSHEASLGARAAHMHLFDGIADIFRSLPPQRAAVVTGGRASRVQAILDRELGGIPRSLTIILGVETPGSKTQKIRDICSRWGHAGRASIYIGDTESDILAAHAVPIDSAAVGYGYQIRSQVIRSQPTFYLETPDELATFIRERVHNHGSAADVHSFRFSLGNTGDEKGAAL